MTPDAYLTKSQAARKAADEAVLREAERVARFLAYLKAEGRTERYRRNRRTYLAQWAEALAGRDLRHVILQELKRELAKRPNAKKHRLIASWCCTPRRGCTEARSSASPGASASWRC